MPRPFGSKNRGLPKEQHASIHIRTNTIIKGRVVEHAEKKGLSVSDFVMQIMALWMNNHD